jgi:hypothetical protein
MHVISEIFSEYIFWRRVLRTSLRVQSRGVETTNKGRFSNPVDRVHLVVTSDEELAGHYVRYWMESKSKKRFGCGRSECATLLPGSL